jgi:hypothetical protein
MKQLLPLILYTNLWVAFCFATLVFGICTYFHLPHKWEYSLFGFSGITSAYQLHRFLRIHQYKDHISTNARLTWMLRNKLFLQILFVLSSLTCGILFLNLATSFKHWVFAGICGLIVILYAFPLPYFHKGIRSIPFIKILLISGMWALICYFPFIGSHHNTPTWLIWNVALTTFIQIIPFDMRDLSIDDPSMHTIPQLLGKDKSRLLGTILITFQALFLHHLLGFNWFLILFWSSSIIGFWIPINNKTLLFLEFIWEIPLLFLGLFFTVS